MPSKLSPHLFQTFPLAFYIAICQYVVMVCPYCQTKLTVSNSRPQKRTNSVWRRRSCPQCQAVFTSIEQIDPLEAWVYKDGSKRTTPFVRDILFISVYESLRHRKTAPADATALTDTVLQRLQANGYPIKSRHDVITTVTDVLNHFDSAAATAYQAYHPLPSTS